VAPGVRLFRLERKLVHNLSDKEGGLGPFRGLDAALAAPTTCEAGIGKTTLWEAGIGFARERGVHTLVARPSASETRLSFAGLIDLFEGVGAAAWVDVPAPQRLALEIALLRAESTGRPAEPQAIALGALNGLRALAASGPLLIAIDDIQWLDSASALWWRGPDTPQADALSNEFWTPPKLRAAGDPTSHVFDPEGSQHVFLRTREGHIAEYWWSGGEAPHRRSLTDLQRRAGGRGQRSGKPRVRTRRHPTRVLPHLRR
jgi:hypothetical protein